MRKSSDFMEKEEKEIDPKKEEEELYELLHPKRKIELALQREFGGLPNSFVVTLVENSKEYSLINVELLKYFLGKGIFGVYVTINKPLADLNETLKRYDVNAENVVFVDAITRMSGGKEPDKKNFYYVDSPDDLIELSIAIEKGVKKISGKKFVIIDSISTLAVYNKEAVIEKFVHSIAGKLHAWKVKGVFVTIEETEKGLINTVAQFCDKIIRI